MSQHAAHTIQYCTWYPISDARSLFATKVGVPSRVYVRVTAFAFACAKTEVPHGHPGMLARAESMPALLTGHLCASSRDEFKRSLPSQSAAVTKVPSAGCTFQRLRCVCMQHLSVHDLVCAVLHVQRLGQQCSSAAWRFASLDPAAGFKRAPSAILMASLTQR